MRLAWLWTHDMESELEKHTTTGKRKKKIYETLIPDKVESPASKADIIGNFLIFSPLRQNPEKRQWNWKKKKKIEQLPLQKYLQIGFLVTNKSRQHFPIGLKQWLQNFYVIRPSMDFFCKTTIWLTAKKWVSLPVRKSGELLNKKFPLFKKAHTTIS